MFIDNLQLGLRVVVPIFAIIVIGHLAARRELIRRESFVDMNNLVFTLFIPAHLFNSIASGNIDDAMDLRFLGFMIASVVGIFVLLLLIIPRLEKNPERVGVVIQSIFRGNFVILGFPILSRLYGPHVLGLSASVLLFSMPLFNIMSILVLNHYAGKPSDIKTIVASLFKSPLVIATLLGLLAIPFTLPDILMSTVGLLAQVSTPLALFVLGGLLEMKGFGANRKALNISMVSRLILLPLIIVHLAYFLGFRAEQLMTVMVFWAAPTAVVSYTLTLYLGGDARLAQQTIIYTTALSVISYVAWIYYILTFLA